MPVDRTPTHRRPEWRRKFAAAKQRAGVVAGLVYAGSRGDGMGPTVVRYGFAAVSVVTATLLAALIEIAVGHFMNFPFYAAVVAAAWFGTGPGFLAFVMSTLVVEDAGAPPLFDPHIPSHELPAFMAFVLFALMCLAWSAQRRKAQRVLEATVRQRTGELLDANAALQIEMAQRQNAETERRRTDRALREAEARLASALRLATVAEIAAAIAHEINQPLAAIVANGAACSRSLAQQPPLLDLARQAAADIVSDGHRAGEVIARIRMLFSREPPQWLLLDINDAIRRVLDLSSGAIDRQQVVVHDELSPAPLVVEGDPVQLQQVLLNLVTNALEAMAEVAGLHRLTIRSEIADQETVAVTVEDSGRGLDPEEVARIFAGFYTTKPDGIGIGLSISRTIADAHGGSLSASAGHGGASFCLKLPLARRAMPAEAVSQQAAAASRRTRPARPATQLKQPSRRTAKSRSATAPLLSISGPGGPTA